MVRYKRNRITSSNSALKGWRTTRDCCATGTVRTGLSERRTGVWTRSERVQSPRIDCIQTLCEYYDMEPHDDETFNNAWGRKTFVTLALGELMMSEERVQAESRRLIPFPLPSGVDLAWLYHSDEKRLRKVGQKPSRHTSFCEPHTLPVSRSTAS